MNKIDSHYGVYLDKVFQLAKTLVIKSEAFAEAMNQQVILKTGNIHSVDRNNLASQRYYMNVCGEYHPQDLIELKGKIKVISMDTLEEIEFTKENLRLHRTTFKEYQYGTRKYEELVSNYPHYEILILGILYPADMDKAINSPDGTILSYQPELVEFNEYSFIEELQKWIYAYKLRWTNRQYQYSDLYYDITNLGVMYLNLIPAILTIRKRKCKTNEAHSYHVRQYLASHGFLDDYLDVLTTKQALRFYRNINYIERNIGKADTFKWLTREVLTERNLPLSEYSMYHDTSKQIEEMYSEPVFKKKALNGLEFITKRDNINTHQLLDKEQKLAPYNWRYQEDNEAHIKKALQNSLSNKLKTKVLESKVTDYSDAQIYRLSDTLLNLWLDWSDRKVYKSVINFNNIKTGERIPLNAKDAFFVYFYAYWRWMGVRMEQIPEVLAERVPIYPIPNKDTLFSVVPKDPRISFKEKRSVEEQFADDIISLMPTFENVISIEAFYNKALDFNVAANMQYNLTTLEEDMERRAFKEAMTHRLYADRIISPPSITKTYPEWIETLGIKFSNMTRNDWRDVALDILNEATGVELNNTLSLRSLHTAMIRLMIQLSSYSVQYIKDINTANMLISGESSLRLTTPKDKGHEHQFTETGVDIIDVHNFAKSFLGHLLDKENFTDIEFGTKSKTHLDIDPTVDISGHIHITSHHFAYSGLDVYYTPPNMGKNPRGDIPVIGIEGLMNQPLHKQRQLKDVWGHDYYYKGLCNDELSTKDPLEWTLNKDLHGFHYSRRDRFNLPFELNGFTYSHIGRLFLPNDLNGFNYGKAKYKQLLIGDLIGFNYRHPGQLYLPDPLNGFDYRLDKRPLLNLGNTLNGFNYRKAGALWIDKLLDGFSYNKGYSGFTLNKPLNGFDYRQLPWLFLDDDLRGFNYQKAKPLWIGNPLFGFSYRLAKALLLGDPLDGFNYNKPASLVIPNPLDGFDYPNAKGFTLPNPLNGFNYHAANGLSIPDPLNGFSYRPSPSLSIPDTLNGFNYRLANGLSIPNNLNGFNYRPAIGLSIPGTLNGFSYHSAQGLNIPNSLNGFSYHPAHGLNIPGTLNGFNYYPATGLSTPNTLNGFGYKLAKPLKVDEELNGFDYRNPKALTMPETLNGFTYHRDKSILNLPNGLNGFGYNRNVPFLSIPNVLNGFSYTPKGRFDLKQDLNGFSYRSKLPMLNIPNRLNGFSYNGKGKFTLPNDLIGFGYHKANDVLSLNQPLGGFTYAGIARLALPHALNGFSFNRHSPLVLDKALSGFDYSNTPRLVLPHILGGFSYNQQKPLSLEKALTGFSYSKNKPFSLDNALDGFRYALIEKLILNGMNKGFDYHYVDRVLRERNQDYHFHYTMKNGVAYRERIHH